MVVTLWRMVRELIQGIYLFITGCGIAMPLGRGLSRGRGTAHAHVHGRRIDGGFRPAPPGDGPRRHPLLPKRPPSPFLPPQWRRLIFANGAADVLAALMAKRLT